MANESLFVVFSHGQESGPWGTKISHLADVARAAGAKVDSIDYRGITDPTERVSRLVETLVDESAPLLLVGSSMGGHVAASAANALRPRGLFLLAPAFFMPGFEALTPTGADCPTAIVHGWSDDIVPPENSIRFAADTRCDLHLIAGDHRLTEQLPTISVLFRHFIDGLMQ